MSSKPNVISNNLVTLALYKFSYATTIDILAKPIWTHLPQRDNLFAVFDQVAGETAPGRVARQKILKIAQAGELLVRLKEHVD